MQKALWQIVIFTAVSLLYIFTQIHRKILHINDTGKSYSSL